MKRLLLSFLAVLLFSAATTAQLGIYASAVYLDINGTSNFYNTQRPASQIPIGFNNLNAQLGVFGFNSGNLKLVGAELRTIKNSTATICGGNLFYAVYPLNERPASPEFSSINLGVFCNCNGSNFNSCGGGTCNNINEQKLQNVSKSIDLTTLIAGNYTIELYFDISGTNSGTTCSQQQFDNAGGNNYKADFTISDPLSVNLSSFGAIATDNSIKVKWTNQNDIDIEKYEIEKSSTGLVFTPIGSVNANGLPTESKYIFSDNDPIVGTNYYRMKTYHKNSGVIVSAIIRIYFGKVGNTIFIYPNPSGSELSVRFAAVNKGRYQMSILGNTGQRILTVPIQHDGTDKTMKFSMPVTLPKGLYRLFLIDKVRFYKQGFLIK